MLQRTAWFERKFEFDLPQEIVTRRLRDCWSIQESVGHLLDLEPLWSGRLDDLLSGAGIMRPADLENRKTHEANHNKASVTYLLTTFREMRLGFVDRLDTLDETSVVRSAKHPRLDKPMRTLDLVFFIAEHDDHHLAWITELRRAFSV